MPSSLRIAHLLAVVNAVIQKPSAPAVTPGLSLRSGRSIKRAQLTMLTKRAKLLGPHSAFAAPAMTPSASLSTRMSATHQSWIFSLYLFSRVVLRWQALPRPSHILQDRYKCGLLWTRTRLIIEKDDYKP